jgi:hypothetical protein
MEPACRGPSIARWQPACERRRRKQDLAHHLQRVVWAAALLLAAVAAHAAEFSHRKHLSLNLTCTTCHAEAPTSTRAEDNLLPRAEVCRGCHVKANVPAAPRPRFVAKFNHSLHVHTMKCESCHALPASAANPGFPAMQFCIGCHNNVQMPESCMKCHLPTQQLKPANHTPDFVDVHSSRRLHVNRAACQVCHGRRFTC